MCMCCVRVVHVWCVRCMCEWVCAGGVGVGGWCVDGVCVVCGMWHVYVMCSVFCGWCGACRVCVGGLCACVFAYFMSMFVFLAVFTDIQTTSTHPVKI